VAAPSKVRVLETRGKITSITAQRLTLILHLHIAVIRRPGDVERFADVVDGQSVIVV
jgi:hypothetical protein